VCNLFIITVWFQRERCEALHFVATVKYVFSSHGEVSSGKWHGNRNPRTSNGGMNHSGDEESALGFVTSSGSIGKSG
jgi:hypothetical protein